MTITNILSRATFPGAPSYSGVKTWVEGSQTCGRRTLAEASNPLGYKEYTQQDFSMNNAKCTLIYTNRYKKN